jgi:hypothetical protein
MIFSCILVLAAAVAAVVKHSSSEICDTWRLLAIIGWSLAAACAALAYVEAGTEKLDYRLTHCCRKKPKNKTLMYNAKRLQPDAIAADGISSFESSSKICYVTDVEGHWEYFVAFVERSGGLRFVTPGDHRKAKCGVELELLDGWTFVFGGDTCDKGPGTLRFLQSITDLKERYPTRVFLLFGNRDINKMRWTSELQQSEIDRLEEVPPGYWVAENMRVSAKAYTTKVAAGAEGVAVEEVTPEMLWRHNTKKARLCYFLMHDMGSDGEFEFRRQELEYMHDREFSDEEVVQDYEKSVAPGGIMTKYIQLAQMGVFLDGTLFVHGQIIGNQFINCTQECWSLGVVPDNHGFISDVREWLVALNSWAKQQVKEWMEQPTWRTPPTSSEIESWTDRGGAALIEYGTPATRVPSVVYCRYLNEKSMPIQFPQRWVEHLVLNCVHRVVVGHTPHGNAPTVVQHIGLTLVMGDTSYSDMNSHLAYLGDQRGDAVSAICIDSEKDCVQVSWQLPKPRDSSQVQRVVNYVVKPLGRQLLDDSCRPDPFVGRLDGQIQPEEGNVWFVKARLPQIPGMDCDKYLLCNIDRYKVEYKEVDTAGVEVLTSASIGDLTRRNTLDDGEHSEIFESSASGSFLDGHVCNFGQDPLERHTMVRHLFNEVDLDRDGVMTAKELHAACSKPKVRSILNCQFPGLNIEAIMKELDNSGEGKVTCEEFVERVAWPKLKGPPTPQIRARAPRENLLHQSSVGRIW